MSKFGIALHGGAGTILKSSMTPEKESLYKQGLEEALKSGWKIIKDGGSSLDAVTTAVVTLENNPLFNAGKGSVFTSEAGHEMDASVMNGKDLSAGSISNVSNVKNPVLLARAVMENSEHVYLSGKGAEEFARLMEIPFEDDKYFFTQQRFDQLKKAKLENKVKLDHSDKKFGTVGAVAVDSEKNLAAATSTGGMTNKQYGRIGDSSIIGAGTYANNKTCAVSCTGHGEYFIRSVTAYDVSCLMEYRGLSLSQACELAVNHKLKHLGGEGGLVAIDAACNIYMPFNCEGMYRASVKSGGDVEIKIYK